MNRFRLAFVGSLFLLLLGPASAIEPTIGPELRDAIRRAVPYLQQQGVAWIEERGCVSCHQVPFMLWSLSAAQSHGFDVEQDKLQSWQRWSTEVVNFVAPAQKSDVDVSKTLASNIDTMNALLLAIPEDQENESQGIGSQDGEGWRGEYIAALVKNQQADGSWQACGQLPAQKRPKAETTQATVLWSLLALATQGTVDHDLEAAIKFVENDQPVSTEWWAARLLLSHRLDDGRSEQLRSQLIARQHEDGGWGWLTSEASDALATGMALYALRQTSRANEDSLERAQRFLIATQQDDGSWSVPGTKESSRNKSTPTSDYWGTAWAVIGLLAIESSDSLP